ncbi:MAG: hypothetical protein U0Y10_26330 [Spirosomataceae bacterium]
MTGFVIKKVVKVLVFGTAAVALFGWVTMSLWNWLMPFIFGLPLLTFWQALGLLILSKLLFGGFKGGGGGPWQHKKDGWKQKMAQHWNRMSPEQRERFRQHWEKRCKGEGWRPWNVEGTDEKSEVVS